MSIDLAALKAAIEEATPLPWEAVEHSWARTGIYAKHIGIAALDIADEATEDTQEEWERVMAGNAALIVAAVNALPGLIAALEAALADAQRYREALDKIAERTGSDDPCRRLVQIARDALSQAPLVPPAADTSLSAASSISPERA